LRSRGRSGRPALTQVRHVLAAAAVEIASAAIKPSHAAVTSWAVKGELGRAEIISGGLRGQVNSAG
jgi:hypothetical protein